MIGLVLREWRVILVVVAALAMLAWWHQHNADLIERGRLDEQRRVEDAARKAEGDADAAQQTFEDCRHRGFLWDTARGVCTTERAP